MSVQVSPAGEKEGQGADLEEETEDIQYNSFLLNIHSNPLLVKNINTRNSQSPTS